VNFCGDISPQEGGDWDHGQATFHCHLVDPITSPGMSTHRWVALGRAVVAPCVDVGRAGASQHQDSSSFVRVMEYITAAAPFYTWILLMALIPVASAANIDISPIAWSFYIAFVANVTRLRINARKVCVPHLNPNTYVISEYFFRFALGAMDDILIVDNAAAFKQMIVVGAASLVVLSKLCICCANKPLHCCILW
jgi:hypothetical protein